jgi:hypothetical protein
LIERRVSTIVVMTGEGSCRPSRLGLDQGPADQRERQGLDAAPAALAELVVDDEQVAHVLRRRIVDEEAGAESARCSISSRAAGSAGSPRSFSAPPAAPWPRRCSSWIERLSTSFTQRSDLAAMPVAFRRGGFHPRLSSARRAVLRPPVGVGDRPGART